jgi:hypothetical protein
MAPPVGRKMAKVNAVTAWRLIELLMDGTHTIQQLADETGMHRITVEKWLRAGRNAGILYVDHWETDVRGRRILRVLRLGRGKDAKCPKLTDAEKAQRYRDRKKAHRMAAVLAGKARFVHSGNNKPRFEEIEQCA